MRLYCIPILYLIVHSWCDARVTETERRLSLLSPDVKTLLVSHWPLVRQPTEMLRHPESHNGAAPTEPRIGTVRFLAEIAVYGHLHIPLYDLL